MFWWKLTVVVLWWWCADIRLAYCPVESSWSQCSWTSLSLRRHAHVPLAKWFIWHIKVETLQEFRNRHRIGWIIQDFRETCVSHSLTICLETKMSWRQTPSRKKKAVEFTTVTTTAYQDQLNTGVSKVCEIFKVCGIESLKYVKRVLHTGLLLWRHFHAPKHDAEWNELWLVVWHVGQTASWKLPWILNLQLSVWRSGYARLLLD